MIDPLALCSDCSPSQAQHGFEKTIYGLKIVVSSNHLSFIRWLSYHLSGDAKIAWCEPIAGATDATVRYHVHIGQTSEDDYSTHKIIGQDDPIVDCRSWGHLQAHMERAITRAVRRYISPLHVIHAGAMALNGRAVLLPGNSGAGKSTLVAALALSGFEYYTDEVTVLTTEGSLLPYPKAITLKIGGWQAITALFPNAISAAYAPVHDDNPRHLVAANMPTQGLLKEACPIDFFVFPRYAPGENTSLVPVSKATALARLAERSLNLFLLCKDGLDLLHSVVKRVECYDLLIGDLSEAVLQLESLLGDCRSESSDDGSGIQASDYEIPRNMVPSRPLVDRT